MNETKKAEMYMKLTMAIIILGSSVALFSLLMIVADMKGWLL